MTSKVFFCSKQRAMRLTQEVLRDLRLRNNSVDTSTNTILASRNWRLFSPAKEVEITMYVDDNRVEVAVNVESRLSVFDFGTSEYLEEEILHRLRERID